MDYMQLGKSGLNISRIGFGCMSLDPSNNEHEKLLQEAARNGINFFDTADLYNKGANEELLGKAFKNIRQKVIIATKVGNQWNNDGTTWKWNPSKEYILQAVDESLRRLQTDYIDLYQLHGGTIDDPVEETIDAFELLVQQGKIRYYGISSIRPNVIKKWVALSGISSVMMQYSLLDRRPEASCLPLLGGHGIGVLARGGLAQGLLAGKPQAPYLDHDVAAVLNTARLVKELSVHKTEAQTALQFVLFNPAITSAITGIRTVQQLDDALGVFTYPLTKSEYNSLSNSLPAGNYTQHL